MQKDFLPYDKVRNNAIKLAHQIHADGFDPDVIYVLLRGGAYIGNVISEYFKIAKTDKRPVYYAAVVARSYTGVRNQEEIMVDGWTYRPEYLRHGDKVLLVDDIFDSGRTINHLAKVIIDKGIPRSDLKIAVHDYKIVPGHNTEQIFQPDYYCRKHTILKPEDDRWIHYMSHELVGLTKEELEEHYFSKDPELKTALQEDMF
jgi:hypoxanthine phosphoribosyltransferase